jgi:hypothetical protein
LAPSPHAYSQYEKNYIPLPFTDTIPKSFQDALNARLAHDLAGVREKGKVGAYLKTLYEKRVDAIVKTANSDLLILDGSLPEYLDVILQNIYDANPSLPRETGIYPFRSDVPNAASFGEGTLCLMLGLLARLESEDQIAFVLCHEMAHYHLSHSLTRLRQIAQLNYDKDLKKKIDAIVASPYDRYSRLKQIYQALDVDILKHSRDHESEADSIGLVYFLHTKYAPYAPLRTMQILGTADSSLFDDNIDFRKHFDFEQYPFKDSWIDYRKSNTWYASTIRADTAKTHPDCAVRLASLQRQLNIPEIDHTSLRTYTKENPWKVPALFESVNSFYHFKQYGKSLFLALHLADEYPGNTWLHAMIGRNLYRLYEAQKEHRLASTLELPDPRFDEGYNRFLTFIHKLRLLEVANLAYHYVTTRPGNDFLDEEFLYSLWLCSQLDMSLLDPEEVRKDYQSRFPTGKYLNRMKKTKSKY